MVHVPEMTEAAQGIGRHRRGCGVPVAQRRGAGQVWWAPQRGAAEVGGGGHADAARRAGVGLFAVAVVVVGGGAA